MEIKFTKEKITKAVVRLVVGAGVTKIVAGVIENNVAPQKFTQKVCIVAATFVLGAIAADATSRYTDGQIDKAFDAFNELSEETPTHEETQSLDA